ncbi:hypothetical protein [Sulfuricurvum sp.]|uniref:hypothetical protein n=1 Tax=Sulfuricurvum sp. TaxID=2025608 RepID=UPI0035696B50
MKIIFLSDGIKTISGGIVSAYVLYIFVELKPKYEKEKKALYVLDKAIASVVEGFFLPNIFQHEKSIRHIKFEMKSSNEKIQEAIQNIKDKEVDFLQLKITMQTAHSRYFDFQNLLTLAVNLSPECGLYWLDLIDKIRLLADEMENQIDNPDMNILHDLKSINSTNEMNPTALFCSSLMLRVMEFFESAIEWNNQDKKILIQSND